MELALGRVVPGFRVGATTTSAPGTDAVVTMTGTLTDKELNFVIPRGDKGDTGGAGPVGPIGPTGEQGVQGDTGPVGPPGPDGKSAYRVAVDIGFDGTMEQWILSLKGETGPQGVQGKQGIQGIQGPPGETGKTGATGATGATGKGLDIRGYFDTEAELRAADPDHAYMYGVGFSAPYDIWDWDDLGTNWVNMGKIQGVQGPTGPAGADGKDGKQGIQGPPGVDGATGPEGPIGPAGADGAVGKDGAPGQQGIQGIPGKDGATGPQGPPGANGADGAAGPQGADGAPGKSAYTAATEHGFSGTEAVFGESLAELPTHLDDENRHVTAEKQAEWSGKANQADLTAHVTNTTVHITAAERTAWNGKADNPTTTTATLTAAGWTGAAAPYTQSVTVPGVTSTTVGQAGVADTATDAQWTAAEDAGIRKSGQSTNSVTFKAYGDKPTVDIPFTVVVWG